MLRIIEGGERYAAARRRRGELSRLLLCGADVLAAAAAMVLVLTVLGDNLKLLTLAGTPVVVLFFKVAGLYDREQLRLLRSTLDEAPALLQIAGLYTLTIAMLQPHVVVGHLWGGQIAALWLTSFIAIAGFRVSARWMAGRVSATERCLVIGDAALARRIREKLSSSRAARSSPRRCRSRPAKSIDWKAPTAFGASSKSCGSTGHHRSGAERSGQRHGAYPAREVRGCAGQPVPRMLEVLGSAVEFEDIDGMMMLGVRPFGFRARRLSNGPVPVAYSSVRVLLCGSLQSQLRQRRASRL